MSVKSVKGISVLKDQLKEVSIQIDDLNSKISSCVTSISSSTLRVLLDTRNNLLLKRHNLEKKIELIWDTGKEYGEYIEGKYPN